jgi:hypothetical protein
MNDTVITDLLDLFDQAAFNVLAQQHDKMARFFRSTVGHI